MNNPRRWLAALGVVVTLVLTGWWMSGDRVPADRSDLDVLDLLGTGDERGYRKADPGYRPTLPQDHGAHPDFRSEWWYFTGNLDSETGERFGFQLTFFRFALAPAETPRESGWATRQTWMAHLALTDVEGRRFHRDERFARAALGLAGAGTEPFRVWLEDWSVESTGASVWPMQLTAGNSDFAVDLLLEAGRPPVRQGADGYSAKGPGAGNASHYYSYTRLPASGMVRIGSDLTRVSGDAWLDREWGTSALGSDVAGWDWFAVQLEDGRDLTYYRLRRRDGSSTPFSSGSIVDASGRVTRLTVADVELTPQRHWTSTSSGVRYPVGWTLELPDEGLSLTVDPWIEDQEMDLSVRYWEGAVRVQGDHAGVPVRGRGYLEMTGYTR